MFCYWVVGTVEYWYAVHYNLVHLTVFIVYKLNQSAMIVCLWFIYYKIHSIPFPYVQLSQLQPHSLQVSSVLTL